MTPVEILTEARKLITDPAKWTQHFYAHDADGKEVMPTTDRATCFCSIGALHKVTGFEVVEAERRGPKVANFNRAKDALYATAIELSSVRGKPYGIADFNDARTHEEVLVMFDKAIEKARAEV